MKKLIIALLSLGVFASACTNTELGSSTMDSVFKEISTYKDYTFYKNDSSIVHSSPQSGHNAYFRVRFNAKAASALTDNGKLPANATFPEGSIIVKDLYDTQNGAKVLYSVLKKESANTNSGNGWLWMEYDTNGKEIYKMNDKGAGCISCHSIDHRDNVRLFNLF